VWVTLKELNNLAVAPQKGRKRRRDLFWEHEKGGGGECEVGRGEKGVRGSPYVEIRIVLPGLHLLFNVRKKRGGKWM